MKDPSSASRAGVPIQTWINQHTVSNEMLWKGAWGHQLQFLRDTLQSLIGAGLSYHKFKEAEIARVISTHTSKSIELPVVEFVRPDLGVRFIVRNNFHDWKLTVLSEKPIEADFGPMFYTEPPPEPEYTGDHLVSCYFEGFPKDLIRGYWSENKSEWSAEIYSDYHMYMVVHMCMRALGALRDAKYTTQEEHRKQLDAETAEHKLYRSVEEVQES
jgi:hypothetical protein